MADEEVSSFTTARPIRSFAYTRFGAYVRTTPAPNRVYAHERMGRVVYKSRDGQLRQYDNAEIHVPYLDEPHSLISQRDEPLAQFENLPGGWDRGQEDGDYKKN